MLLDHHSLRAQAVCWFVFVGRIGICAIALLHNSLDVLFALVESTESSRGEMLVYYPFYMPKYPVSL